MLPLVELNLNIKMMCDYHQLRPTSCIAAMIKCDYRNPGLRKLDHIAHFDSLDFFHQRAVVTHA